MTESKPSSPSASATTSTEAKNELSSVPTEPRESLVEKLPEDSQDQESLSKSQEDGQSPGNFSAWNHPVDLSTHDAAYPESAHHRQPFVPEPAPILLQVANDLHLWVEGVDPKGRQFVRDLVDPMRVQFFERWGVHLPPIRVAVEPDLRLGTFVLAVYDTPIVTGMARRDHLLVAEHPHRLDFLGVQPEKANHPVWHRPAAWVHREYSHLLVDLPLRTWDCGEYLILVMSYALQSFSSEFIGIQETQSMLQLLSDSWPDLVQQCLHVLPLPRLRRVLRLLAEENISLYRLRHILEILVDAAETCRHVESLVDEVRRGLRHHLCHMYTLEGQILAYLIEPALEHQMLQSWQEQRLRLSVDSVQTQAPFPLWLSFLAEISRHLQMIPPSSTVIPVIVVREPRIRRFLHQRVHTHFPWLDVLAVDEIDPRYSVSCLATLDTPTPTEP